MWHETAITSLLGINYPIIQAGMAGGNTTPELVAAVSNAGGLGTLGAAYMSPDSIRSAIREIRSLTKRPFAVNLLIVDDRHEAKPDDVDAMEKQLKQLELEIGASLSFADLSLNPPSFSEQLKVVIEEEVPIFSFAFGIPSSKQLEALKRKGTKIIGTATTVEEAKVLEAKGVDAIVAQGSEAGGHRGTFAHTFETGMVGLMALVPQMVDQVNSPVVASGGIMDGRGILAALMLGAAGVQMGTAFLTTTESGAHPSYKAAIQQSDDVSTVVTRAFSGRPARGIRNTFIERIEGQGIKIPEYPVQNALTQEIRGIAKKTNNPEWMSLWSGQAGRLARSLSAKLLMEELIEDVSVRIKDFYQ